MTTRSASDLSPPDGITRIFETGGMLSATKVAALYQMNKSQLAETIGLKPETLHRDSRSAAGKSQARMAEMVEIVERVSAWAGGRRQALAWYRAEPIPAFGGRTAESLVKQGKATAVRDWLDTLALGGFA